MAESSVPEEQKQCTKCGEWKPFSEFRTYKEVAGVGKRRQRQRTECTVCAALGCKARRERIRTAELEIAQKRWETVQPERRCYVCTETKAIEHFRRVNYMTSTGKQSWRFDSKCIECGREKDRERYRKNPEKERSRQKQHALNNPDAVAATSKRYRERNPEKLKMWREWRFSRVIETKYGVTFEQFKDFVERHGRKCMICEATEGKIGIDHCHKTGRFRGILCSGCNLALGNIKENVERARGLALYIEMHCS